MTAPGWYNAEGDPPGTTRYWDGDQWVGEPVTSPTAPVGPGGYTTGHSGYVEKDGKLIAAGVLSIISGVVVGGFGLFWLILVNADDEFGLVDDFFGSAFTAFGVVLLIIGIVYLVAGIGSVQGKQWGRIFNIVIHGIGVALFVIGAFGGGDDAAGAVIPILWTGTALGLSIFGKAWR